MPLYEVQDPLGRILQVEGESPPNPYQVKALFERYDAEEEERFAEERTFGGQIAETLKAIPRGFAGSFLTAGEGLAELADAGTNLVGLDDAIDSGDENELVRLSRDGRAALQEAMGADEAYRDTWATKFGEGLGSFASFFTPAAALKVAGATGKIAGFSQAAGTGSLAVGVGAGEQAQRMQAAKQQGIDISEDDEDLAILGGSVIGLSELLPVNRLLRRISADVDPATKIKIRERLTGALATGTAEGVQEAVASVLQDAVERGVYNEDLPVTGGDSLFEEFTIGGAVGAFADLALNGAAGRRRQMAAEAQTESQADEREALENARQDLSARVSAAMAAEADTEIPAPIPITIDPAEIDRPSPTQIQSAVGTRLLTPGRYLSVRGPDGDFFQAEEKVSFKKDRRNPDRKIEERYVRKVNDDGSFSTITISRDGQAIPGIEVEEISAAPETVRSKRKDDPLLQYARHVRRLLGDDLLKAGSFTFTEERSADGAPVFRAVDSMGQRYGKAFETKEEAATFAGNLNSQLIEANVSKSIEDSIDASGVDVTSLDQKEAMFMYGYRILHPDQNLITSAELDQAGETTVATGFQEMAIPNSELGNYAPVKLTMSQRINRKRLAQGKPTTNMFTLQEAKAVLRGKFGNLRTGELETETYAAKKGPDGNPVVVSSTGEVITGHSTGLKKKGKDQYEVKPFVNMFDASLYAKKRNSDRALTSIDESVFANKRIRERELRRLLKAKNISTKIDSPAFKTMVEAFTGAKAAGPKKLKTLSNAEMKILYQKIRSLPEFTEPTELVNFKLERMKPIDYKLEPQAKTSPVAFAEPVPETLALADPAAQPIEGLDQIQSKLDDAMKSVGLSDIKANINHSLRNVLRDADGNLVFGIRQRKEGDQDVREFGWQGSGIVVETSPDAGVQAMYSNAANEIFLGMDRLDTSKPIDQQINEALELLSHEQVHAMRTMNLFTDKEWQTLSKAAANRKSKTEPDKTFLEIAEREYAGEPDEVIIEEAVAELVRVSRKDPAVVTGKPKSLIKKIYNFFADLIGFRDSTGFESFQDLITDIETGVVGARERGGRIPVEARRRAEEVAEQTRTPDFIFIDPELDLDDPNSEVEIISSLNDRMSRRSPAKAKTPKKTVKAYKLFKIKDNDKSKLYPLYVDADTPVQMGNWVAAIEGAKNRLGEVIGRGIGALSFRPGWHSGDSPSAKHIGGKSRNKKQKPDYRKADTVWAEVEVPADVDWQSVANSRASVVKSGPRKGLLNLREADIKDQIPEGGYYRYKTNPNMEGNWIISGSMKVNKILTRSEQKKILKKNGVEDLPTLPELIEKENISFEELNQEAKNELREYYPKKFKELTASARNISGALEDRYARTSGEGLPIKTRIPAPEESAPILPIGDVEQAALDLFKKTDAPTASQLAKLPGAPVPRTDKTKSGRKVKNKLDDKVKPTPFAKLRMMARVGLAGDSNRWYDQFGSGIREIVGEKNLPEASVVFGITSQQNSAEQNLADTLHIMAVARKIDPVKEKNKFIKELRTGKRPGGQGLKITGDQINRITRLYNEGFAEAGLKTSTYMQMIQDRAANVFNPFSVQDVHMARVFGFNRKKIDPKSNKIVDDAKIPTDNSYRYAQFLTSKLAEEFGVTPNQMQAALWFYAKSNLTPLKEKGREGKPGTWESAKKDSQREIKQIRDMVNSGVFDKNNAATPALADPVKASNKITTKSVSFSNILQNEDLLSLARARAPKAVFSANPGTDRGYGFPQDTELNEIIDFNREAIEVITDETGQIPFLRDLGIPHEVTETFGSYEGIEPSITVSLLGGTQRQASFAANVLGDALLQDAAIMAIPAYPKSGYSPSQVGAVLQKKDGSNFEIEDLEVIGRSVNPEKDPYGMNFTLVSPDMLSFIDGRVYDDSVVYDENVMLPQFIEDLSSKLPPEVAVDMEAFYQEGDYFESGEYKKNIRIIGSEGSVPGSSDILSRLDDTLYKPIWELYTKTADRLGFTPENQERPDPRIDERGKPLVIEPTGEMSVLRKRADGSLVADGIETQKTTRDKGAVRKVVEENEKAAVDTPATFVPEFNYRADPEAQYVAKNPEEGLPPNPNLLDRYSRKNSPELSQEAKEVVNRIAPEAPPDKTPGQTYLENTDMGNFEYWVTKARQSAINKWARLEQIARLPQFKENLADTSAMAAALFSDRSMGIVGSALKSGVAVYRDGVVKVEDFFHTNKRGERKQYRGLVDVMAPLFQNSYGVSLEELAQAYAVARRAEGMRQRGLPTPAKAGDLALIEAEIAKYVNENGDSIIEEWYDTWQAYNNKTVEFMKATGLVDDALAQKWLEMSDYIPFYRQGEAPEGEIVNLGKDVPAMFKSGMTTAFSFKKLRGSEKGVNIPMLDAITRNLSMAIDAGMKNVAQQRIVRDMVSIGIASKATPAQTKNKTQNFVVSFRVNGEEQNYKVDDPLLYESLQPVESGGLATSIVAPFSKLLREMITRDPGFMLANMMRDTLSAYTTSGSDFIPVVDTVKNIGQGIEELERFGVVGGYDFGSDPEDIVKAFADYSKERGINVEGGKTGLNMFMKLWNAAGRATTASDAATRRAVYNDVLARTGNEAEAAFQALEVINFSRRGRSPLVRFLTAGIPFLNARVQGLDVLYRGFMGYNPANREKTRSQAVKTALARGGLITASTMAYWLLVSDDDQYKDTPDEQKDLNWLIPTPFGVPIRIPVPFEVGFIFKTIPERILDTYPVAEVFGKPGATSSRELTDSVFRGLGSTFELNPFGLQIIAPMAEAAFNYNFFTGREIVPLYASKKPMQGLVARESNMEISKFLGESFNISPMKIDHVLYGYTGTIGGYMLDAIDQYVAKNPVFTGDKATAAPSKSITELPLMKRFFVNEFSSDNRADFYRLHNAVNGVSQAINNLIEDERIEEAQALMKSQGHLLEMKSNVNYISDRLSNLRKLRAQIERSDAEAEVKREILLQINEDMEELTAIVPKLKKYADLPAFPRLQLIGI